MASAGLTAVVTGGTGAIGQFLVAELLGSPQWRTVRVVGRKRWTPPPGCTLDVAAAESSGRLQQHEVDTEKYDQHAELFSGVDASFCIIGAPKHKAGSKEAYWHINRDLPLTVGRLCKAGVAGDGAIGGTGGAATGAAGGPGCRYFTHVSSVGASKDSIFPYLAIKGQVESSLAELKFQHLAIWRPGLLDRGHMTEGWQQRLANTLMGGMPVSRVAMAMRLHAEQALTAAGGSAGQAGAGAAGIAGAAGQTAASAVAILTNDDINRIAGGR